MKPSAILLLQIVKNVCYKTKPSNKLLILFLLCLLPYIFINYGKSKIQHIAFISATYYKTSSIYPNNTVVILFNGQHPWRVKNHLVCKSSALIKANNQDLSYDSSDSTYFEDYANVKLAFIPIPLCNWTTYIAVCKVAENAASLSLTAKKKSLYTVTVPIRNAIKEKYNVIACFSPLFYNERWQLLFSTLEIYRQNGVDLQIYYIQSIREELMNLLKKYKKAGVVDIEKWVLIDLGAHQSKDELNPNAHLAWRNQAASHTDCFLKYREAAEFIIVADIDDILFAQLGKKYFDEFRHLSNQYPLAAGFTYNRTHLKVSANKTPKDFSLPNYLSSLKQTGEWGSGKSVVIPSRVQTVWLHWPIIIEKNYEMIDVPNSDNIMLHFTKWIMLESTISESLADKITTVTQGDALVDKIIESINKTNLKINADKFIGENAFKVYENLPTNIIYYPLIEKCYFDIFYSRYKERQTATVRSYNPESCPGPIKCQLPPFPGIHCIIAKRKYLHKFLSQGLEIHYPSTEDVFQKSLNGCSM